ncbi:diguanylate cyclase domain-containing protein [Roseateles sp. BYS87W]|uniref:diguanylate cyclase domain-containing protein n=1 Tax=Pelomonas baiyunensis TaxID=3299026 RepID=UPI003747DC77
MLWAPTLAFGAVLTMLWMLVAAYVLQAPHALLQRQRDDLATGVRAVAMQTEPVLHQAESALRGLDLWLLNRPTENELPLAALQTFAGTVRDGSHQLVDVMLLSATGQLRRLGTEASTATPAPTASLSGTPAFDEASQRREGITLGLPVRVPGAAGDLRSALPLLLRLTRPRGDDTFAVALIDLQRLHDAQSLLVPPPPTSLVMLRNDGLALTRRPDAPGFVGRNLFDQFPTTRQALAGAEGFFASTGAATDGQPRIGAFVTLDDVGVKLVLSATEDAALDAHRQQRSLVLLAALAATVLLLAVARGWHRQQRADRLREATLQATSNAMPLGLFRTDATGRIVYVNDSYLQVHGLRRDQVEWGWTTLVQPEQRDMLIQRWKHHMATGEPIDMVRKMKRGDDGRIRWISVRTAPLWLDGRVAGQAGTVEDVTERGEQHKAHRTLAAVFDMTPDFVCQANERGDVTYLNPAAREHLGMAPDAALAGAHIDDYFTAEQLDLYRSRVLPQAMQAGHWRGRITLQRQQSPAPMDCLVIVHRDVRGRIETVSVILRDLSEQLKAQRERERSEAMLLAVAHTARAQFLVGDLAGRVVFFNAAFEQHHRVELRAWAGRPIAELFDDAAYAARAPLIASALAGETRRAQVSEGSLRDARSLDVQYAPLRVQSGKIDGVIAIEVDVTDARREEARLRAASQTDPLTQLLNRTGFEEGARQLLTAGAGQRVGLLYLDLDRFKPVNDQHGHPTGDALLKAVALRLRHALRPADLVARLGGDEFAVLLPQLHGAQDADTVAHKLLQALSTPYHIGELELEIGVSVGFCVATTGSVALEALIASADAHLYEAKRAGRGCVRGAAL